MQVITTDSLEALRDKCRSNPEIVNKNFSDLQDELGLQMVDFNGQVDYESLPSLQLPQGKTQSTNNDSANIKIISRALESLSAAEGTDERFWVTLCFDRYAEYTRARWKFDNFTGKVEVDSKKHKNHVKNHWFAKNSRNRMRDNAVSRLWWMGHIANRVPDMEIDEVLERLIFNSDFRSTILERNTSANAVNVAVAILLISEKAAERGMEYNRSKFRTFMKKVNFIGLRTSLPSLSNSQLEKLLWPEYEEVYSPRSKKTGLLRGLLGG